MMKLNATILIVLLLVSLSSTAGNGKLPKWLQGTWEGTGYQTDGVTWEVVLNAATDLSIDYPTLGCGGQWTVVRTSKNRIELEENLTSGEDKCDKGVKVTIFRIDDRQLSVIYALPSYQKNAIAHAVLVRQ